MLLMPVYGDQFHNSYVAKDKGVAEVVPYDELDEPSLRRALNKIFNDSRYAAPRVSQCDHLKSILAFPRCINPTPDSPLHFKKREENRRNS